MPELIEKIRFLRETNGISQEFMAFELGISQPAYSKLERGETKLTISRLQKIAFILGFSTAELMNNNMEVLAARLLQR